MDPRTQQNKDRAQARIKAEAARLRLEQSDRKQALAAKTRLDKVAVDIEEGAQSVADAGGCAPEEKGERGSYPPRRPRPAQAAEKDRRAFRYECAAKDSPDEEMMVCVVA